MHCVVLHLQQAGDQCGSKNGGAQFANQVPEKTLMRHGIPLVDCNE